MSELLDKQLMEILKKMTAVQARAFRDHIRALLRRAGFASIVNNEERFPNVPRRDIKQTKRKCAALALFIALCACGTDWTYGNCDDWITANMTRHERGHI